jgi:hypothetical protein
MRRFGRLLPATLALIVVGAAAAFTGAVPRVFSALSVGSHGNVTCTGVLAPGTYKDVQVPSGQSCTINSADVITHDVVVASKATLDDLGASIGHDLRSQGASRVNISATSGYAGTNATVGHDLTVEKTVTSVSITNNTIGHNLIVEDNSGSTTVTGNNVGHDADCRDNTAFTGGGNIAGHADTCN